MIGTGSIVVVGGIAWAVIGIGCGGRTNAIPLAGAGGDAADAPSEGDSSGSPVGPQAGTILEGYAYVGDWTFSKETENFVRAPCGLPRPGGNHRFWVPAFSLDVTPITNGQYAACVQAGPCTPPERDVADPDPRLWDDPERRDVPALASQKQAELFCGWANGRLPSWAELTRAAQGEAEIPGVAELTSAAIDCYSRGGGDPMVCGQLALMDTDAKPQPKLYRVGAVELDRGPDGHRDLFGVAQRTRTFPGTAGSGENTFCNLADDSPDYVTLDPSATQHVVMWFGTRLIGGIKTRLGFGNGLLDDGTSEYPVGFRCAHDIAK